MMRTQLQNIERLHLGLLAAAVCAACFSSPFAALSLLLGGAVMGINFWLLRQVAARLVSAERRRPEVVVGLMLVKFTLFIGLLGVLFWRMPLDPLAFGIGASLLLVACVASTLSGPSATEPA
jgi:ATP synthase I chain